MGPSADLDIRTRTGQRLRQARHARGLNLHELARLTGISASALSLIETGKRDARIGTLEKIVNALGITLAEIFAPPSPADQRTGGDAGGYDLSEFE